MAEKTISAESAWARLFGELVAALRVPVDEQDVPLDVALSRLQDSDRETRRTVAEAVTAALEPGLRTRAFIYNTLVHDKAVDDRLRSYPHWLASPQPRQRGLRRVGDGARRGGARPLRHPAALVPAQGPAAGHRAAGRL